MGGVIAELKQWLLTEFAVFRVRAVPRSCNRLAHSLAALGYKLSSGAQPIWDDVPYELESLVSSDSAVTSE